jgi:hypothetical protein
MLLYAYSFSCNRMLDRPLLNLQNDVLLQKILENEELVNTYMTFTVPIKVEQDTE